jgi:ATP-binding protein involved in chromosome partitioning
MTDDSLSTTIEAALRDVPEPETGTNVFDANIVHGVRNDGGTIAIKADLERLDPNTDDGLSKTILDTARDVDGVEGAYIEPAVATDDRVQTADVDTIIAVASTKGGVGKTTVATRLAAGLAIEDDVALFDADIFGPNIPELLDVEGPVRADENDRPIPIAKDGMEVMSVGLLTEGGPLAWRGAMAHDALSDLFADIAWDSPDILVIDLPPGTSDVLLTTIQEVPIDGVVVVTTPFQTSVDDTQRSLELFHDNDVHVLGTVVNMARYKCPTCGDEHGLFEGDAPIDELNVPLLAEIPFDHDFQTNLTPGSVPASFEPVIPRVRDRLEEADTPMVPDDALDVRGATVEERKERVATAFTSLESGDPFVMLSDRDPSPVEGYLIDLLDVDGSEEVFDTFRVHKRTPDTWVLETVHP